MKLNADSREFVALLNANGVRYLIVGGHAVAFHGRPRFTADIDIFVEPSHDNAVRIERTLREFGFAGVDVTASDLTQPDTIVQLGVAPNRIDIITSIDAVEFPEAWASKMPATLDNLPVHFISKSLLMRNKKATGRSQDLADIEQLEDEA